MKIAIFTDTFTPDVNGVAKTLDRLTNFLESQQIDYRVFTPKSANEEIISDQVHEYHSLPLLFYPECRIALPKLSNIKAELLDFDPDIIHVATPFNMGLTGLHFAKKLQIPIVGSYHTDFNKYLEHYHLQFLTSFLWKYLEWFHQSLEKVFVPSLVTKEQLEKYNFNNLIIWPRGVDQTVFHPNSETNQVREKYQIKEKYILLYVGRIAAEKDVMLLPKIAKQLPNEIKENVHWLVVGDGPLKNELLKDAPENMTLTGYLSGKELAKTYATSDLFVFPSGSETFGNVVLEALACGVPVVGADAGGVRSIVKIGETGLLCPEKNSQAFTSAIVTLLKNPQLRRTMSEAGLSYAKEQSWDKIFHNLVQEYRTVLLNKLYQSKQLA